jgi:hypothetical protein
MAQKMRKNESSAARKRESAHRIEFVCFVKRHQKLLKVAPGGLVSTRKKLDFQPLFRAWAGVNLTLAKGVPPAPHVCLMKGG